MGDNYILDSDGKTPIRAARGETESAERRRVAKDSLGEATVSTVFLGIDHQWEDGPPVLWETMIFGGPLNDYQVRYTSYNDAVEGHQVAVRLATEAAVPKGT
jgi:hypothetical protein